MRDQQVRVRVQVSDAEGKPLPNAQVNAVGASVVADSDGRALLTLWPGVESQIHGAANALDADEQDGRVLMRSLIGTTSGVVVDGEQVDLILRERRLADIWDPSAVEAELLSEAEARIEDHDAYVLAALREPNLSKSAKAQLTYWLDRSHDDADALDAAFAR